MNIIFIEGRELGFNNLTHFSSEIEPLLAEQK